nr:ATP-binding cassette domain-containing protein [Clostridioides difficile]
MDSKEQVFHFDIFDLNELSRNIISDWIPVLESSHFEYEFDIPEIEYFLRIDANAYTRIINNLNSVKRALEIVGLPYKNKKLFSKYSLGMKQRLGIANAILHDPELLVLDEPTNGLDPIGIAEMRKFIRDLSVEHGKTILISSHILSEISLLADDIGIIDHGVLLEESSMSELESLILERQFNTKDYSVQDDHTLRLYNTTLDMGEINKALVMQNVTVISSQLCNDTLEDYFKKITGGEGIA